MEDKKQILKEEELEEVSGGMVIVCSENPEDTELLAEEKIDPTAPIVGRRRPR